MQPTNISTGRPKRRVIVQQVPPAPPVVAQGQAPPPPSRRRRRHGSDDESSNSSDSDGDGDHDTASSSSPRAPRKWIRVVDPPTALTTPTAAAVPTTDSTTTKTMQPPTLFMCTAPGCPSRATPYASMSAVREHLRECHTFVCETSRASDNRMCKARFPSQYLLDLHLDEVHSSFFWARVGRGDDRTVFKCLAGDDCSMADGGGPSGFASAEDRKQHMLTVHRWGADTYKSVARHLHHGAGPAAPPASHLPEELGSMMVDLESTMSSMAVSVPTTISFGRRRGGR
ncbi:hypothetical protein BC828DRAFT_374803 [Blastocladiella britannica]|nr:hypothetical protein BC828DRAFT_374803 [Blastocladiella britannica]